MSTKCRMAGCQRASRAHGMCPSCLSMVRHLISLGHLQKITFKGLRVVEGVCRRMLQWNDGR